MNYTITQIQDAIITTLQASVMGTYCRKIDSYEVEGKDLEDEIRIFSPKLPCALILYPGSKRQIFPGKRIEKTMQFSVLLCAESLRERGEARRGSVGVYKMVDDIETILTGNTLGLDITPLLPGDDFGKLNTQGFSVYSIEFETKCNYTFS